jgi:hypothetical protein
LQTLRRFSSAKKLRESLRFLFAEFLEARIVAALEAANKLSA